jgi:hypothetical protein
MARLAAFVSVPLVCLLSAGSNGLRSVLADAWHARRDLPNELAKCEFATIRERLINARIRVQLPIT